MGFKRAILISAAMAVFASSALGVALAQDELRVEAQDNVFLPDTISVKVGDTVVFDNTGDLPHTTEASDGSWDSGNLDPGQTFSVTFEEPGTVDYICVYHEVVGMVGTIEVAGSAGSEEIVAASSEEGPIHLGPTVLAAIGVLLGIALVGAGLKPRSS
jgi:plastocyanin